MADKEITKEQVEEDLRDEDKDKDKKVTVTVDTKSRHVRPGVYTVSDFKRLVKVPADYDLDQLLQGELTPLADDAKVTIKGGEVFVSHARQGGSS